MRHGKLEPCYYGKRQVIYVQVRYPDQKNGSRLLSVYGYSFEKVLKVVDKSLASHFGKTGGPRPKGKLKQS